MLKGLLFQWFQPWQHAECLSSTPNDPHPKASTLASFIRELPLARVACAACPVMHLVLECFVADHPASAEAEQTGDNPRAAIARHYYLQLRQKLLTLRQGLLKLQ